MEYAELEGLVNGLPAIVHNLQQGVDRLTESINERKTQIAAARTENSYLAGEIAALPETDPNNPANDAQVLAAKNALRARFVALAAQFNSMEAVVDGYVAAHPA